uniref:Rb1-inducible coiled coil protein 1-like protein n=1 Tax=Adineta vaga TaxID=104782 RepID=D4NWE2_ADIVA|nr:Rb1-inducible coiled coil protein 1-like protein [Adineta vaga]
MLYVFRVDIGETYTFETDLAFQDVKTLKSTIEREYSIAPSKQILIISGGELLDDDAVQVCMKTRETCAGTEENPIYLLDKSHLERSRPISISLTSNSMPLIDDLTINKWLKMKPTYETIVQRANIAQDYNRHAQKIVQNCEQFIREQQAQYQGWMAVIANIEDTLSLVTFISFFFHHLKYSLPHSIEILHQLKLPNKLTVSIDNSTGIYNRSNVSTSTSSSSISLTATTSTTFLPSNENESQSIGEMSLFEWITAQLANMKIDDVINSCTHIIDEVNELFDKNEYLILICLRISNHELKHMIGIEERFALLQTELVNAKHVQHEQKDYADYLVSQRQKFSSSVANQKDLALIEDLSGIHSKNLNEIATRHNKLIEIEKKIRKSKQDIIDQLHRRFKNMMLLQRHLVDYDAKQSLYIHKLNRTRKTMAFLRQLNQAPHLYYSFLHECVRRKQYSNIFNQFSVTIHRESKNIHHDEVSKREQFIKQYEKVYNLFYFNKIILLFISELPNVDPTMNLSSLIRCTETFLDDKQVPIVTPLSVFIPSSVTTIHTDTTKQLPSPTNSSSRSTVVRSQSSSDVESPSEQIMAQTLSQQTIQDNIFTPTNEEQNDETLSEKETVSLQKSPSDTSQPNETSPSTISITPNTTSNNEEEDDYIQCSLETVYTSTEMAVSPPSRPCASQQTDNEYTRAILQDFLELKTQYEQTKSNQHDLILNYHETISKVITSLQQSNQAHQEQIEQLHTEINNHIQDNETVKIQYDISEQLKQELTIKYETLKNDFDEFRRTSDIETSQIVKALQSDFEFELEKLRGEHQETVTQMKTEHEKKQISTMTMEIQTDEQPTFDQQTSMILFSNQDQSTETNHIEYLDQTTQTSTDDHPDDAIMRRSITKDQQIQFNLAIQRAVQNATGGQKKQIGQLEQQLADKRVKIVKLKECIKNLQNLYTLSSTPPPMMPSVANSMITSSTTDDEQVISKDDEHNTPDETTTTTTTTTNTTRQAFLRRSEPISMPSTFIAQSMLAAGNAASSPKIEPPVSAAVHNISMDTCFKSSPNDSSAAVELYTPFAASPPNQMMTIPLSPQTPLPVPSSILSSSPSISSASRLSTISTHPSPQATPIAFFTVNRSDHVIIYFDTTYQHYMIYTYLPTLHFIHSDCYELFNIQSKQPTSTQTINTTSVIESISGDIGINTSTIIPPLINTSMINSTLFGPGNFSQMTTPLLGQVTDKEYCQAKKPNNRFNVPLYTKFYRVRVKPWKPSVSSSTN